MRYVADEAAEKNFRYIEKKLGTPLQREPMPASEIDYLRGRVPARLVQFMEDSGEATYLDGAVTVCRPSVFEDVLRMVFQDDPDLRADDCTLISYGVFGLLSIWSQRHGGLTVYLVEGEVSGAGLAPSEFPAHMMPPKPARQRSEDFLSASRILSDVDRVDFLDFAGQEMFAACLREHGPVALGECYGFVPALALVGLESPFRSVAHIKRLPALEHFAILAQAQPFHIRRLGPRGMEVVRKVGGA